MSDFDVVANTVQTPISYKRAQKVLTRYFHGTCECDATNCTYIQVLYCFVNRKRTNEWCDDVNIMYFLLFFFYFFFRLFFADFKYALFHGNCTVGIELHRNEYDCKILSCTVVAETWHDKINMKRTEDIFTYITHDTQVQMHYEINVLARRNSHNMSDDAPTMQVIRIVMKNNESHCNGRLMGSHVANRIMKNAW